MLDVWIMGAILCVQLWFEPGFNGQKKILVLVKADQMLCFSDIIDSTVKPCNCMAKFSKTLGQP